MIRFNKLFAILALRGMKKTDLLQIMGSTTLASLSKEGNIETATIGKICAFLDVQPGDIMEYVKEPDSE